MSEKQNEIFNQQVKGPEVKQEVLPKELDSVEKSQKASSERIEVEKKDKEIEKRLPYMDNNEFLCISREDRLSYITNPEKDYKKVNTGDSITFTFSFIKEEGKELNKPINENLYLKTTAGQVLPPEVREVTIGGEIYTRENLLGEFFTPDNKRLIIHDGTTITIGKLRSKINNSRFISSGEEGKTYEDDKDSVDYLMQKNQEKVAEFLKNNPNSDENIVREAYNRGIDPKFASITFSDLIKGKTDEKEIKVILEDAFTEFDRTRGKVEASMTMKSNKSVEGNNNTEGGRYDENLIINLLKALFPGLWKEKAVATGFSDEEITNYEKISNTKIDFSSLDGDVSKMIEKTGESLSINSKLIKSILMQESGGNMSATRFEKHVYDRELRKGNTPETAKLLATSFGGFQIMGFNYKTCGYNSVQEFVEAMKNPEEQFNAFSKFIKSNNALYGAMKKNPPDFPTIAYNYNGSGYAQNRYDKMIEKRFYA